ncbi:MAG: 50S ribosomal protein L24 [Elusimicrobiales bacterium]|jgi:large subunit ribosomal protein L24|nr:50S ribosomal protein L24 [Elusimicrobiales bacterium]
MLEIKKKDQIIVLSGKDKGKKGEVIKVLRKDDKVSKILVRGINMASKHKKPTRNDPGGIVKKELPIDVSKVMLVCPGCSKPTRIKVNITEGGKFRVCKKCGQTIV